MNRILAILILFVSCNDAQSDRALHETSKNSKAVRVQLIDSLGTIMLSIPIRYDTSFSWVHYSDCGKPCDEQKYRFQPKELPIVKESGWIWSEKPMDSIDRFTISHTKYFPFHNGDTTKNLIRHNHLKEQLLSTSPGLPIIFDTIEKIYDRYYSIMAMEKSDSLQFKKVLAVTTIRGNEIKFEYQLSSKRNDSVTKNFIRNSIELLRTIRISKGS